MVQEQIHALHVQVEAGAVTRGAVRRVVDDALQGLGLMVNNLRRAAELIQSFKQVAVDRGQTRTRRVSLDLFLQELVQSLSPLTRQHGAVLVLDAPGDLSLDLAAGELQQILTNLVVNALTHAFPAATQQTLQAAGQRPTITISAVLHAAARAPAVILRVTGNGCGMEDEVARRALEPFFTTKRGQGGTGLGLHIAYSLVTERFAGTLELTTVPQSGTVWTLVLPMDTAALQPSPATPKTEAAA